MKLSDDQNRKLRQVAKLGTTVREFGDALKGLGLVLLHDSDTVVRGGIKHAIAVERYYITAQAIGVSREDAEWTLAESERYLTEWPWWFDAVGDAERRLKLGVGSPSSRPPVEFRRAAREMLSLNAGPYTPADVDALALRLEVGLP